MKFDEFEARRARLRVDHPSWLDAGETNLYRALPAHFPDLVRLVDPAPSGAIHRCHLASKTLDFLGLAREQWESRLAISRGVRDSLRILFQHAAAQGIEILIPSDVYPVYQEIATAAGVKHRGWEAQHPFAGLGAPAAAEGDAPQWLLIPDPVKPWGRSLGEELPRIRAWAAADARRRVVIDAVYSPQVVPASAQTLLAAGVGIALMSLSKGWLSPQKMGWALFSERDAPVLRPLFMGQDRNAAGLAFARQALQEHPHRPARVAAAVAHLRAVFVARIAETYGVNISLPEMGYLIPDAESASAWEDRGVISIPASVFGSTWNGSFLSVLSLLQGM